MLEEAIAAATDRDGDNERALRIVEMAANAGNAKAQNALCHAYRMGIGVPEDRAAAFGWCLRAGEQGEIEAKFALGEICSAGLRDGGKLIASRWYLQAAEQGHADAQFAAGRSYENGHFGAPGDEALARENALRWYLQAAGQGDPQAQLRLGEAHELGQLGLTSDASLALDWYRKAAEQGFAEAQVRLGDTFAEGKGVPVDYAQAYMWYRKALDSIDSGDSLRLRSAASGGYEGLRSLAASGYGPAAENIHAAAEQGVPEAQRYLAYMYANGQGTGQDFVLASKWLRRLHVQDEESAMAGFRYLAELGHASALEWLRELAVRGNARAQYQLGSMHASGEGAARNDSEAVEWLFQSAQQGNILALIGLVNAAQDGDALAGERLRMLAERGDPHVQLLYATISRDFAEAIEWMRKAAEQNHSWAQAYLGLLSYFGMPGADKDKSASVEWIRRAAEQGVAVAQLYLGILHFRGDGVSKDLVQAYAWLRAGADHARTGAIRPLAKLMDIEIRETGAMIGEFNDRAARILGPERLSDAELLAREYRERYVFPYQCSLLDEGEEVVPQITFEMTFEWEEADTETDASDEVKDVVELGRHVVTGSRIRRIDVEEARPVVVITREDILLSGRESVADVLRNNPVNSLGSSRERSGSSWIGQATIDIHGIGANRTLVLLDGRRMPRSPITANQAVDLNIIPLAAVERVEILTDSASAIYGSDAIGGVVNIILRKDYEGMEVRASADRPAREGADAESGGLTLGGSTDRGRFLFSADFRNKEHIASADRFYTLGTTGYAAGAANYPNAPFPATWTAWEDADNVSSWGNTIWPRQLAAPTCEQAVDPATGRRVLAGPYIAANGEEHCGFHYALSAWETTDLNRASVFLHADYELTPAHALRVQSLFSTQNVHGRFAPPPGDIPLTEAARAGLKQRFGFDLPYPELLPYTLRHRFIGMGDRDFKALLQLSEHALLAYGSTGFLDYELEVRHTRYHGREDSCCFPKAFTTREFVAQGRYNPFDPLNPGNADALAGIRSNSSRDSRADFRSYSGNAGFDMFRAPGGPLSWAFGFDYFDEKYRDTYDPLSAGGDLLGRLGINGQGERLIRAVFGETLVPLLPGLQLSAALRWDQYDDAAGSELSSYLSARYQPARWLLLRASWGEGFRAGSMNNLYDGTALHLQTSFDLVKCRRDGIAPSDCIEGEFPTYTGGNPALRPELSDSYNLGAVLAVGSLTARVDYWNVDLENGISLPPLQGLIGLEFEGQCANTGRIENTRYTGTPAEIILCGSGSLLKRDPVTGALIEADVPWDNTYRAQFSGADFQLIYDLPTAGFGNFQFRLHAGTILRLRSRSRTSPGWSSGIGTVSGAAAAAGARPSDRSSGAIIWRYGDHTVSAYAHYVGGFGLPEAEFSIASHTEFDLFYQWAAPWDGGITLGVKNLTDEDPELGSFSSPLPQAYNLYSLDGRILYASYRHTF